MELKERSINSCRRWWLTVPVLHWLLRKSWLSPHIASRTTKTREQTPHGVQKWHPHLQTELQNFWQPCSKDKKVCCFKNWRKMSILFFGWGDNDFVNFFFHWSWGQRISWFQMKEKTVAIGCMEHFSRNPIKNVNQILLYSSKIRKYKNQWKLMAF